MSFADLIARMRRFDKNAEVIFNRDEPVGTPTDLVMARRRWFRRGSPSGFEGIPKTGAHHAAQH